MAEDQNGRRARTGLRIAQVAPLYESVPPKLYGGTERVVADLCHGLIRRGHDVTLFASGDSSANVRLRPGCAASLRLAGRHRNGPAYHLPMLNEVYQNAANFDVIHSHVDFWDFPLRRFCAVPSLSTTHCRLDQRDLAPVYRYYRDLPLVSISDAQRRPLPELNWVATIYHGLPEDAFQFNPGPGKYLAFLGRLSPEKRPELAIEVARRAGIPLRIAAKVDEANQEYFETIIKPLLSAPGVEYLGEIGGAQKQKLLAEALALLFPIDWPEPFGLVMIEALACGTPIIARPRGAVPEIIRDGVSGFVREGINEMAQAAREAGHLSRRRCREEFERRFTLEHMVAAYEQVYYELVEKELKDSAPKTAAEAPGRLGFITNGSMSALTEDSRSKKIWRH